MFGLGTQELLVILAIAFLVFGGKKLPEIGAGLGKGLRAFKKGVSDLEHEAAVPENALKEDSAKKETSGPGEEKNRTT
jgi:sec-independent protein translocase protein TatA